MSVVTRFWDVSDPFLGLVSTLFLYSQVPNTQTTSSEHWHLEFHSYWRFLPSLLVFRWDQVSHSCQDVLLVSLELLDTPHNAWFVRLVFSFPDSCSINFHVGCVRWHWNFDHYIICKIWVLKNGSQLYRILYSVVIREFLNYWSNFERQVDALRYSVSHDFKKSIWGNKSNRSVPIEPSKPDTLMKLNVINLNSFLLLFSISCIRVIPY